jgi:cytosine/adenosine deaminase-related metal-dependent hydrolase
MSEVLSGVVVTGDGRTRLDPGYLVMEAGVIVEVGAGRGPAQGRVDVGAAILAPGLINVHTHGLTLGPIHATGSPALRPAQVQAFKDRHLQGGTTTALSVDGFPTWAEFEALAGEHPLEVLRCTAHTPANARAAALADGAGIEEVHRQLGVAELLAAGARVIGEIGAGGTLGGGMQDYLYIPAAIERACGVRPSSEAARAIKEAVLGRRIDPAELDRAALEASLAAAGLAGRITPEGLAEVVRETVMPSMFEAFAGIREAAAEAARHDVPFMVHHAAASAEVVLEVADRRLIAAHCNHPSFTPAEALHYARLLRERGALLELSGLNLFGRKPNPRDAAPFRALVEAGLVDLIGTDYAGGDFDPVSVPLFAMVREGLMTLEGALACATGRVAEALPSLTEAGLLAPGRPADVAVFSPAFDAVVAVYKRGRRVVGG